MTHSVDAILDATGLNYPEPVMMLHNKACDLALGSLPKVIAIDPSTRCGIPKFCMFLSHELVEQQEEADTYLYWIRKKADQALCGLRHPTCFSAASP